MNKIIKQFKEITKNINLDINLYALDGKACVPENAKAIPSAVISSGFFKHSNFIYLKTNNYILSIDNSVSMGKDILNLVSNALQKEEGEAKKISTKKDAIYSIIFNNELTSQQTQELINEFKIETNKIYCAIVVNYKGQIPNNLSFIDEVYPASENDIIYNISSKVCLIFHELEEANYYEVGEFVNAFTETLLEEYGDQFKIGVSEIKSSLNDIRKSYLEAKKSIAIGEKLESTKDVFFYPNLLLERILLELPENKRQAYINKLFNDETNKVLNDEMLLTVNAFLEKDLNLSDAARHLYIHRNTLVYRLDKIQKTLGLDFRKFNEATIFKVLSTMYKLSNSTKE